MEVEISAYYSDDTRGIQEKHSVSLNDSDGERLFGDRWNDMDTTDRNRKLFAYADILLITQGMKKGFRYEESAMSQIKSIYERDLT